MIYNSNHFIKGASYIAFFSRSFFFEMIKSNQKKFFYYTQSFKKYCLLSIHPWTYTIFVELFKKYI